MYVKIEIVLSNNIVAHNYKQGKYELYTYFSYLSWGFPRIVITLSPNVQVVN